MLDLFRDAAGKPRAIARMPGSGPTWLSGLTSLPDASGEARLVATYVKIKPPMVFNEDDVTVLTSRLAEVLGEHFITGQNAQ